ncbi:hypothetical protein [Dysgonomonas sp. GY617]|uniref:hypothetical protein n=1 Tax=Dysgonomonas sp. GY617 TaxID=2780420 RepID=UPI0018840FDE|nr:hypothetical protein [Dysgonomonas sp. GY617]MBF0577252.1 hypothetical protein [Dysgonomonas sp. GY617]
MIFSKKLRTIEKQSHVIYTNKMPYWVDNKEVMEKDKLITIGQNTLLFDMDGKGKKGTWIIRVMQIIIGLSICLSTIYTTIYIITKEGVSKDLLEFIIYSIFSFFLFILGVIVLIKGIYYPDKKFLFNRIDGTITMPDGYMNLKNKTVTILFENAKFYYNLMPKSYGMYRIQVWGPYTYGNKLIDNAISARWLCYYDSNKTDQREYASLFTWFMDKNRPLPPGAVFDPYREADYLRRESEGFLPPIYLSHIPISETKVH